MSLFLARTPTKRIEKRELLFLFLTWRNRTTKNTDQTLRNTRMSFAQISDRNHATEPWTNNLTHKPSTPIAASLSPCRRPGAASALAETAFPPPPIIVLPFPIACPPRDLGGDAVFGRPMTVVFFFIGVAVLGRPITLERLPPPPAVGVVGAEV